MDELRAASFAARWSIRRSSKFFLLPGTARRSEREWVLHVRERVQGFPWSTIWTPQCLLGSYSRSLQGSSFLSRATFLPEGTVGAAVPPLPSCFRDGKVAAAAAAVLPGPGPGPERSPETPGVSGGGCWGEGSSFLSPPGEGCLSRVPSAGLCGSLTVVMGMRSTLTTGTMA